MAKPLYTPDLANEVLAGIASGLTEKDACGAAGISEDTLERWKQGKSQATADFADRFKRAVPRRSRRWLSKLGQAAEAGDVRALCELLDRCSPYRKSVDVTHSGTVTHNHRDASAFTDAEIDALAAIAERRKTGELVS